VLTLSMADATDWETAVLGKFAELDVLCRFCRLVKKIRPPERFNQPQTVTTPETKKARYLFSSKLFNVYKGFLVGSARFELATDGLRVRCSTS
jgi:hypothetical protein